MKHFSSQCTSCGLASCFCLVNLHSQHLVLLSLNSFTMKGKCRRWRTIINVTSRFMKRSFGLWAMQSDNIIWQLLVLKWQTGTLSSGKALKHLQVHKISSVFIAVSGINILIWELTTLWPDLIRFFKINSTLHYKKNPSKCLPASTPWGEVENVTSFMKWKCGTI